MHCAAISFAHGADVVPVAAKRSNFELHCTTCLPAQLQLAIPMHTQKESIMLIIIGESMIFFW